MKSVRAIGAVFGLISLQGCVAPLGYVGHVKAEVPTAWGRVWLVQNGPFALVAPGTTMNLPLPGYIDAKVVGTWRSGSDTLIAIAGPTINCPLRYTVAAVGPVNANVTQLGTCGAQFGISQTADGSINAQQIGAADPLVWRYGNRQLAGPALRSSVADLRSGPPNHLAARRPTPAQPPRQMEAPEGGEAWSSFTRLQPVGPDAVATPVPDPGLPQKTVPVVRLDDP